MFSTPSQYTNYKIRGKSRHLHYPYYGLYNLSYCFYIWLRDFISMAVIPFRIPRRSGDVLFQSGIFEEDDQQPVLAVQLLQISQLAIQAADAGKIGIQHQKTAFVDALVQMYAQ